jgi:hypothetical protein
MNIDNIAAVAQEICQHAQYFIDPVSKRKVRNEISPGLEGLIIEKIRGLFIRKLQKACLEISKLSAGGEPVEVIIAKTNEILQNLTK